jgi:hypothetical protein
MQKIKRMIKISSVIVGVFISVINLAQAKEVSKIEYEKDGMTFVVGRHEPEKRVNPEQEVKIIEKVMVKEVIIQKGELAEEVNGQIVDENGVPVQLIKEENNEEKLGLVNFVKKIINDLKANIEGILSRLGIIEDKMKNVDNLVETTSRLTDEVINQNARLESIEGKLLQDGVTGATTKTNARKME